MFVGEWVQTDICHIFDKVSSGVSTEICHIFDNVCKGMGKD